MNQTSIKNLLTQTKNERRGGAPSGDWVLRSRDILLMQVANTTDVTTRPRLLDQVHHLFDIFIPFENVFVAARTFGVFLLLTATVLGGGLVSAQLYANAMPGEMLYGMKLAVEKTQLLLSPNVDYRVQLHTDFANRRANELAWLSESVAPDQKLVVATLASFEKDVVAMRAGLEEIKADDPNGAVEVAKTLEREMTSYNSTLQKAAQDLPPETRLAVNITRNRIDDTAVSALAIIVQNHLAGDVRTPRNVVVNKFEDRINQAEDSLNTVIADRGIYEEKSKAIKAKTAIAEAKLLLEKQDYQAALTKISEVAQLTKEAEDEAAQDEIKGDTATEPAAPSSAAASVNNKETEPANPTKLTN